MENLSTVDCRHPLPPRTEGWPDESDHRARLGKLSEFYATADLAHMFNRAPEEIKGWMERTRNGPKIIQDDLDLLNRLDAAVRVTKVIEGRVSQEHVRDTVFKPYEQLNGRSLADMVAGPQYFLVGEVVERAFGKSGVR